MDELEKKLLIDAIIQQHEIELLNKKVVFINNNSDRLLITFAAFNSGESYSSLLSHSKMKRFDHLFIKDPSSLYYLSKNKLNYDSILKKFIVNYKRENIILWGSSMGGYAALRLSLKYGISCVVNCPQVDYQISIEYAWPMLKNKLFEIDNFDNITELQISEYKFSIFYTYGKHLLDVANTSVFKSFVKYHNNIDCQFEQYNSDQHTIFQSFKDFLLVVEMLECKHMENYFFDEQR